MTEEEKKAKVEMIMKLLESEGLAVGDLPGINTLKSTISNMRESYCDVLEIGKNLYNELVEQCGKKEAYKWAEEHINSYYRTEMEIFPYRTYKTVDVSITCTVAVPNNWDEGGVKDLVSNLDLYCKGDWEFNTDSEDIEEDNLGHYDYINSEYEFSDSDFDD